MIRYALACEAGHRFESWFRDSLAFDDQVAARVVTCPFCQSCEVAKTIMAPAVGTGRVAALPAASQPSPPEETSEATLSSKGDRTMRDLVRAVRDKLVAEGDDVGDRFAMEARRIHDGVAPQRRIYGQASVGEAQDLLEDGILVLPMPTLPDDLN